MTSLKAGRDQNAKNDKLININIFSAGHMGMPSSDDIILETILASPKIQTSIQKIILTWASKNPEKAKILFGE